MFVNEQQKLIDKINKNKMKIIIDKLGYNNFFTNVFSYISGTIFGPLISFFKKMVLLLLLEY